MKRLLLAAVMLLSVGCFTPDDTPIPTWQPTFANQLTNPSTAECKCEARLAVLEAKLDALSKAMAVAESTAVAESPKPAAKSALPAPPPPYADQRLRAAKELKPLVVWIGWVSEYNEAQLPECLHTRVVSGWREVQGPAVAIILPWEFKEDNKWLWWTETLGAAADYQLIRKRIQYWSNPANYQEPKVAASYSPRYFRGNGAGMTYGGASCGPGG
jgi:hypothetical protein